MISEKELLAQALTHRRRLEDAVKAVGYCEGVCWCEFGAGNPTVHSHTQECDALYLALYGGERGE